MNRRKRRRAFDRAAHKFDSSAALPREIADRMIERLAVIRLSAGLILDAGSGTGYVSKLLRRRFAKSFLIELDLSVTMLQQRANRHRAYWPWSRSHQAPVCADFQCMPVASSRIDLVWSNLALHWADDLPAALVEAHRVLRPGGLLMFSMFGPDTLKELKLLSADHGFRVNPFVDMHDIGDVLVHAGYADPVMDMEYLTLTYANVAGLLHDLKAHGSSCMQELVRKGLTARNAYERVFDGYENFRSDDGRFPATFEIIYGHAWKPAPRVTATGKPVINIRAA